MESIFRSLSDPGAWLSNIAFGLATTIIWKTFPILKRLIVRLFRSSRFKRIKKLRQLRGNPAAITYAIGKATALQAAFIILCFFYVFAILLSEPYRAVLNWSVLAGLALASPIFFFEFVWLSYDSFAESLVKEHGKLVRAQRAVTAP